jgi:hypothetical protein
MFISVTVLYFYGQYDMHLIISYYFMVVTITVCGIVCVRKYAVLVCVKTAQDR